MTVHELPEQNIRRVVADHRRIATGKKLIHETIETAPINTPVALLAFDIDGSGSARSLGIDAKVFLVGAIREILEDQLGDLGLLVDSGTRDEMRVVFTGTDPDTVLSWAESVRKRVASTPIAVTSTGPSLYTISVGVAVANTPVATSRLEAAANSALGRAKRKKNTVSSRPRFPTPVIVFAPSEVRSSRRNLAQAVHSSLVETATAWGPVWYWTQGQRQRWSDWPPRPDTADECSQAPDMWALINEISALDSDYRPKGPQLRGRRWLVLWIDRAVLSELDKIARQRAVRRRDLLNDAVMRAARKAVSKHGD